MDGLITLADLPELKGTAAKPRATIVIGRLDDKLRDPRYGKFAITQRQVDGWKRNLSGVFGGEVAMDFDHSSDRGGGTRAACWVRSIDQTGTKNGSLITADVEFSRRGAKAVRDGDYKYTSPTFVENYTDEHGQKHGPALIGGALTNRPVLRKGMPTLSLSRDEFEGVATPSSSSKRERKRARAQVLELAKVSKSTRKRTATLKGKGKPEFPMPDRKHAQLALQFVDESLKKGNITPADAAKIRARANRMLGKSKKTAARDSRPQMDLKELATQLGLDENADLATVLTGVVTLAGGDANGDGNAGADAIAAAAKSQKASKKAKGSKKGKKATKALARENEDGTIALSAEGYADLLSKANLGESAARQLSEQTFTVAWEKALSEGRAAPAQEETLRALHAENPELAIKTLDSFVRIVPTDPTGSGQGPAGTAPNGMEDDRFQLHTEAKALATKKMAENSDLDEAEAYALAAIEIEERKFEMANPGI